MKVKVIKPFTDKYDRSVKCRVGEIIEMTESRVEEVNSTWRGQLVRPMPEDEPPKTKPGRKPKAKEG